jgi:hypothetical protein
MLPASTALLLPSACCHCQRHTAVKDTAAFVLIIVVVAVTIAVSVTDAAAAFS